MAAAKPDPPAYSSIAPASNRRAGYRRANKVAKAAQIREQDEQEMATLLQTLQFDYKIYNSDIEPEHESEFPCGCPIHKYWARKRARLRTQDIWSAAVKYPGKGGPTFDLRLVAHRLGETSYHNCHRKNTLFMNTGNPYWNRVGTPFAPLPFVPENRRQYVVQPPSKPHSTCYHDHLRVLLGMNKRLNEKAQAKVDSLEPVTNIWLVSSGEVAAEPPVKPSRLNRLGTALGLKEPPPQINAEKLVADILEEEENRWLGDVRQTIVSTYQAKVGMTSHIAYLRQSRPIEYLHLLRAGYFEPIPVAWAERDSNPLKFLIDAEAGWRGITPQWRGYEDTAEERLYWVLNHRDGTSGHIMKPDVFSVLEMARQRMASAVEPPPLYYSADDTCQKEPDFHGYSKQVIPRPFQAFDRPENPLDDTMILLDVSASMGWTPFRPRYAGPLIHSFQEVHQPKSKDVAKAIVQRFTTAMMNHDHKFSGYDLVTFSDKATLAGTINARNFNTVWNRIWVGGGTRVMAGWQAVKRRHFEKHAATAVKHPSYGWQAGPETPILRLLLLLDGEATDMDEFELDLLGLSWAHVTIFLIGPEGCLHHHRHANELQRISDNNHHVTFVDAQGNMPERYVTHELLKRHLGVNISVEYFQQLEHEEQLPPPYTVLD